MSQTWEKKGMGIGESKNSPQIFCQISYNIHINGSTFCAAKEEVIAMKVYARIRLYQYIGYNPRTIQDGKFMFKNDMRGYIKYLRADQITGIGITDEDLIKILKRYENKETLFAIQFFNCMQDDEYFINYQTKGEYRVMRGDSGVYTGIAYKDLRDIPKEVRGGKVQKHPSLMILGTVNRKKWLKKVDKSMLKIEKINNTPDEEEEFPF
jgi:hypothetical protein